MESSVGMAILIRAFGLFWKDFSLSIASKSYSLKKLFRGAQSNSFLKLTYRAFLNSFDFHQFLWPKMLKAKRPKIGDLMMVSTIQTCKFEKLLLMIKNKNERFRSSIKFYEPKDG